MDEKQAERGRYAIDALPDRVRVGLFDFSIEKWTHLQAMGEQKWGLCSGVEQRISIQADMPSPGKAVETFLHELLHAIYWNANLGDDEKEEHVVGHLSAGLALAFRDNTWLTGWISNALTPTT